MKLSNQNIYNFLGCKNFWGRCQMPLGGGGVQIIFVRTLLPRIYKKSMPGLSQSILSKIVCWSDIIIVIIIIIIRKIARIIFSVLVLCTQVNMMFVILLWVYIHTGRAWKICPVWIYTQSNITGIIFTWVWVHTQSKYIQRSHFYGKTVR
jgi:hypothetical protein